MENKVMDNYDFKNKNEWRRKVWSIVRDMARSNSLHKRGIVLYLAGPQDLDRKLALQTGFASDDLLIIERDAKIAKKLKKKTKSVIHADFNQVLENWPKHIEVAVVLADICSGITQDVVRACLSATASPAFKNAIFIYNLMRGRDPDVADLQALLSLDEISYGRRIDPRYLHRGYLLAQVVLASFLECPFEEYSKPKFMTYKSSRGNIRMDSVIFSNPWGFARKCSDEFHLYADKAMRLSDAVDSLRKKDQLRLKHFKQAKQSLRSAKSAFSRVHVWEERVKWANDALRQIIDRGELCDKKPDQDVPYDKTVRDKISAAIAVRTMRINGQLPHAANE